MSIFLESTKDGPPKNKKQYMTKSVVCKQDEPNYKLGQIFTSNFFKAVFHKFYLVHSCILCPN